MPKEAKGLFGKTSDTIKYYFPAIKNMEMIFQDILDPDDKFAYGISDIENRRTRYRNKDDFQSDGVGRIVYENLITNNIQYQEKIVDRLNESLRGCDGTKIVEILDKLKNNVKSTACYYVRNIKYCYFEKEKVKLYDYISNLIDKYQNGSEDCAYAIYLCIYFSVIHRTPEHFHFGVEYKKHLEDFNNQVLCKTGVSGNPGLNSLLELADKENVFALFELGELYYYGRNDFVNQNYAQAFKYYGMAHKNKTCRHPLALWSLAYIYYNYRRSWGKELSQCKEGDIPCLDGMTDDSRLQLAIDYARESMEIDNNPAAANLLGQIVKKYKNDSSVNLTGLFSKEEYFKRSSEGGYVYGINNYAFLKLDQAFYFDDLINKSNDNLKKQQYNSQKLEAIDEHIRLLQISANKHEPWAANKLGQYYKDGIPNEKGNNYIYIFNISNNERKEKMKEYFELATTGFDKNALSWGYINLLDNFLEDYSNTEIDFIISKVKTCGTKQQNDKLQSILKEKNLTYNR